MSQGAFVACAASAGSVGRERPKATGVTAAAGDVAVAQRWSARQPVQMGRRQLVADMGLFANIGLAMVIFFCVMEAVEFAKTGVMYFSDVWNVMDWLNFLMYYLVYGQVQAVYQGIRATPAGGAPCASTTFRLARWTGRTTTRMTRTRPCCAKLPKSPKSPKLLKLKLLQLMARWLQWQWQWQWQ